MRTRRTSPPFPARRCDTTTMPGRWTLEGCHLGVCGLGGGGWTVAVLVLLARGGGVRRRGGEHRGTAAAGKHHGR